MDAAVYMFDILQQLRDAGWRVAIHNDYRLNGEEMTFWLMTRECGLYLKGEGRTDVDALAEIEKQARRVRYLRHHP